jgi:hypothetical protein
MKHILLLTTTATLFAGAHLCLAQRPLEPGLEPPVLGGVAPGPTPNQPAQASQSTVARSSRRTATPAPISGSGLAVSPVFFSSGSKGDSIPPVVIRFSQSDPKTSATMEEDLFVMARIISRTLERAEGDKVNYKMNIPMLLTGSGRSVRPMYIEGLGPLFMIKVNFALLPPAKAGDKKTNATPPDTEWDVAHQEVFGPAEGADEYSARSSSYNQDQVELLKKELMSALKNATNIRALKPDEFVNIAVFGHASSGRGKSYAVEGGGRVTLKAMAAEADDLATASKGSVLTLRAKKSDIDAFAGGKLEADAFKTKVATTAYFGSGVGISSINSWIQESAGKAGQ